jgi:8-oxo-dGTP diphosphatase
MTATPDGRTIEAAGGVLWRPARDGGTEVALIHRPKYDDWSLPKGKLDVGEHVLAGALREIVEETGFAAAPGRPIGTVRYHAFGAPKRVRYWAMRAGAGAFVPGREVDDLAWLSPELAARRLSADRDGAVLAQFAGDPRATVPLVVVRHASAGDRDAWAGDDADRPLDPAGEVQARRLAALLAAYGVAVAVTSTTLRCRQTLAPFVETSGLRPLESRGVTDASNGGDPSAGVEELLALVAAGRPAVVSTQREVIPDLVAGVCQRLGATVQPDEVGEPDKGGFVVLHVSDGADLVAWERLDAP